MDAVVMGVSGGTDMNDALVTGLIFILSFIVAFCLAKWHTK